MGQVEDDVLHCFKHGGGVPYDRFPRFHDVMAEDSGQTVLPVLTSHILPLVPGLVGRLVQGIRALDVACGRGLALLQMAERYPASRFTGMDFSGEAIAYAEVEAKQRGVDNVRFEVRDLGTFDRDAERAAYDLVTVFDGIHDQGRPLNMLKGIARTLRDDGVLLVQDIRGSGSHNGDREHPAGTLLYALSTMHCMTVSLAQGGEGLGTMWGEPMTRKYLHDAGFNTVATHTLAHDFQNNFYVVRK
jgi:ubiquinone/menaquinone biosynthesis C-methylase UbiE